MRLYSLVEQLRSYIYFIDLSFTIIHDITEFCSLNDASLRVHFTGASDAQTLAALLAPVRPSFTQSEQHQNYYSAILVLS